MTRPVGRPSYKPQVFYHSFQYKAGTWQKARRVVAKVEWHAGELFPRFGFVVTNLTWRPNSVIKFYNKRGTAEQWIKEGKYAINWTRLCELLQDCNDNRVACHCIVAFREIGKEDRNVIRCVISQAGLYEKWTDVAIARTLGRIGEDSNEAYKQLREFIASSPETVVRVVAIRALGKIGRKTDLEFLLHTVKDDSGDVREEARKAIGVIRATEGESAK